MQCVTHFQALDRCNLLILVHYSKRETTANAAAINMDGTCAALAMVASHFGAIETGMIADRI
jgi:hypothetical protein